MLYRCDVCPTLTEAFRKLASPVKGQPPFESAKQYFVNKSNCDDLVCCVRWLSFLSKENNVDINKLAFLLWLLFSLRIRIILMEMFVYLADNRSTPGKPPAGSLSSSLYRISRMGGGSRQAWGGYFFTLEKSKISHFFKLENFQKMFKNQWKFYNFLKMYM